MNAYGMSQNPYLTYPTAMPSQPMYMQQNPYLQQIQQQQYQMPQMAAPTKAAQTSSVSGRVISDPNEVMPVEVPTDGRISLFPMADSSAIYAKSMSNNGLIQTIKYIPDTQQMESPKEKDPVEQANLKLDEILGILTQAQAPMQQSRQTDCGEQNEQHVL